MAYNPNIHHRRSIRLKGYDYSRQGLYFVTICCQDKICYFGEIKNEEMILSDAGIMIEKWCSELPNKFPDITLDAYIVMPNHFHAIFINDGSGTNVGADLRVCPDDDINNIFSEENDKYINENVDNIEGEHIGSPLHTVVQWLKTMTTNEYIRGVKTLEWQPFNKKLWQRNYWEHIIRNKNSYQFIANYIINNPKNWDKDKFYC